MGFKYQRDSELRFGVDKISWENKHMATENENNIINTIEEATLELTQLGKL